MTKQQATTIYNNIQNTKALSGDTRHKWMAALEEFCTPHHVHVETSEGSNVYVVYRFARKELAEQVQGCAIRFGLQSFIIKMQDDVQRMKDQIVGVNTAV